MPSDPLHQSTRSGYQPIASAPMGAPPNKGPGGVLPAGAELAAWRAEACRLRAGIEAFLSGDYPNPRRHRPGNCQHGRAYFEDCAQCDAEHFARLLAR